MLCVNVNKVVKLMHGFLLHINVWCIRAINTTDPHMSYNSLQWQIQDFHRGANPQIGHLDTILLHFPENRMKSRKIRLLRGNAPPPSFYIDYYAPKSVCVHEEQHVRTWLFVSSDNSLSEITFLERKINKKQRHLLTG